MSTSRESGDQLLDKAKRFNAMVLNSDINRDQPIDYAIRIQSDNHDESNIPEDDDWVDDTPLEAIRNDYTIDLEILSLRKREPREDNRKRKLCYSPHMDDGYGLSKRIFRRLRNQKRQIRARGKRFRKDDSMIIDEPIIILPSDSMQGDQTLVAVDPNGSGSCLSYDEEAGYVSDEEAVRDEEEMDEEDEEEMDAILPDELMDKMESNLSFNC